MTETSTDLVESAARDAFEGIPGVSVMYAVGKEDDFHPLRVHREHSWRVVVDGWSSSFHRAAMHTLVSPRMNAGEENLRHSVRTQLNRLVNSQRARAGAARKAFGIDRPMARELFDDDAARMPVGHLIVSSIAVMRLLAEEGSAEGVRRRVATIANREIRRREGPDRKSSPDVSLKHTALTFTLPLGTSGAMLDSGSIYLPQGLPEIVVTAAGGWEGGPLSRLVQASGIDHLEVAQVGDGRIFQGDTRPWARGCALVVQLKGDCMAPLDRILDQIGG